MEHLIKKCSNLKCFKIISYSFTFIIWLRDGGCFTLTGWQPRLGALTPHSALDTNIAFLPALITAQARRELETLGETLNIHSAEFWVLLCVSLPCWVGTTNYYTVYTTRSLLLFKYLMSRNASFDRQGLIIKLHTIEYCIFSLPPSALGLYYNAIFGYVVYYVWVCIMNITFHSNIIK